MGARPRLDRHRHARDRFAPRDLVRQLPAGAGGGDAARGRVLRARRRPTSRSPCCSRRSSRWCWCGCSTASAARSMGASTCGSPPRGPSAVRRWSSVRTAGYGSPRRSSARSRWCCTSSPAGARADRCAAGVWLALAIACRPIDHLPAVLVFAVVLVATRPRPRALVRFAVPLVIAGAAIAWLNWVRFEDPFEFGHRFLAIRWQARMQQTGLFALPTCRATSSACSRSHRGCRARCRSPRVDPRHGAVAQHAVGAARTARSRALRRPWRAVAGGAALGGAVAALPEQRAAPVQLPLRRRLAAAGAGRDGVRWGRATGVRSRWCSRSRSMPGARGSTRARRGGCSSPTRWAGRSRRAERG